jgi:hypothetical protein
MQSNIRINEELLNQEIIRYDTDKALVFFMKNKKFNKIKITL